MPILTSWILPRFDASGASFGWRDVWAGLLMILGVLLFVRFVRHVEKLNEHAECLNLDQLKQSWIAALHNAGEIEEDPEAWDSWCEAWRARQEGDLPAATALFASLRQKFPVNPGLVLNHADCLASSNERAAACEVLEFALTLPSLGKFSRIIATVHYVECLLLSGQDEKLIEAARKLMESSTPGASVHPLDSAATLVLINRCADLLPCAAQWTEFNCRVVPASLTLKGTRGAVLCELGRNEEAEPLLTKVLAESPADIDHGISAFYLGKIMLREGNSAAAKKLFLQARLYWPQPWLLERVRELEPSSAEA